MSIFNSAFSYGEISSVIDRNGARIHFAGILGAGTYPLARLLRAHGCHVTGSDVAAGLIPYTDAYGIVIGRPKDRIDADAVVYSLAIDSRNAEIQYARSHGIPLISRAQLLGAVMRNFGVRIAVSGSHGKSTTTAIIDHVLSASDILHTTVSGAGLCHGDALCDAGGDIFLAEACEYKDSFLCLCPSHLVITAVELDHTDYFRDEAMLRASFLRAADSSDVVLLNLDDPGCEAVYSALKQVTGDKRIYTYGKRADADYRLLPLGRDGELTRFSVASGQGTLDLSTCLMGEFNLYNLTAAVAMADIIGVDREVIAAAVQSFTPIDRRMALISEVGGAPIYYDYAHHPSEIAATVIALKERYGEVTVIFRPHTYSRTKSLWNGFIAALSKADFTILLDIYPAREEYIEGVDSQTLAKEIKNCTYSTAHGAVTAALSRPTGAIVLMGAGEVDWVRQEFIRLGKNTG